MSFAPRFLPLAALTLLLLGVSTVRAQKQEQTMLDRINNPDLTLKFDPAEKQFSATGAVNNRTATIKPFAFSKSANVRDGFRTSSYNGAKAFGTKDFAGNKDAAVAKKSFGQNDRSYATHDLAGVKDARDANKTLAVNAYSNTKDPYEPHGRSQGTIDALMTDKNLTIDQVRELLNKNK